MSTTAFPAARDLARDTDRLPMTAMRRALVERGQVVDLGAVQARFQRGNDTFEDDGRALLALETGVFLKLPVYRGQQRVNGHWLYHGSSDQLEVIVAPYLLQMSAAQKEALLVQLAANAALAEDRKPSRSLRP